MKFKKVLKKTKDEILSKDDIIGFRGGMKLNLERKMRDHSGQTLRQVLSTHFKTVLEQEIENNYDREEDQKMKQLHKYSDHTLNKNHF